MLGKASWIYLIQKHKSSGRDVQMDTRLLCKEAVILRCFVIENKV